MEAAERSPCSRLAPNSATCLSQLPSLLEKTTGGLGGWSLVCASTAVIFLKKGETPLEEPSCLVFSNTRQNHSFSLGCVLQNRYIGKLLKQEKPDSVRSARDLVRS